jgi:hypothetical protein
VRLGIAGNIAGNQFVHFFACPKKRTKERAPRHLSRRWRDTRSLCPAWGTPRCCRGFANSLRSDSANPLFGSLSGARLRANGNSLPPPICPAAPRRRGRKKTRELSEGEARVFPRPALVEKQGKPAGPGLAGVPFSCFFFWARKRRKREPRKGHRHPPEGTFSLRVSVQADQQILAI